MRAIWINLGNYRLDDIEIVKIPKENIFIYNRSQARQLHRQNLVKQQATITFNQSWTEIDQIDQFLV